jgi:hypothetical protein
MATKKKTPSGTEDDATTRSRTRGAAVQNPPPDDDDFDDDLDEMGEEEYAEAANDASALRALNDPSSMPLGPAPLLGGSESSVSNLYGRDAMAMGRASSPRLWAQATQFPTCSQLRVWRWENGIPVGLGAIDAEANEEDFVREFFEAMPKLGQGRMMFKLRPIDIRGEEMGKELSVVISEHHAALQSIRRARKAESEEASQSMNNQNNAPIYMPQMQDDTGSAYASEMSRMFEKAVEAADSRAQALEHALLDERERLRSEDDKRAQERIDLATNAAAGVQAITERMMRDESNRAERSMKSQTDQSQMLLTTLTQIFASAQAQQHSISETARAADQQRLEQERQYSERGRMEQEERRKRDMGEMEERRKMEQTRLEDERKQLHAQRDFEMKQMELRAERERQELLTKLERDKAESVSKLTIEERRLEKERQDNERRVVQMRETDERKLLLEKSDIERRTERERLEWEHRWKLEAEERDRRERLSREERERMAAVETERRRLEMDERERRDRVEREERDRRSKLDSEMAQLRTAEMERRARSEEEAARLREAERQRSHDLAVKQMEVAAGRDREHAERMLQMQQLQMQEQRATMEARERREKDDSTGRDADRLRQHERMLKDVELQSQKDREHAERMMQLTQMQYQQKAFGGLGELIPKAKEWLSDLGLEPADIIQRVFSPEPSGGGGGGSSGWADAIPKVLGSLAEMGKVAIEAQAASKMPPRQMQGQMQNPMMGQMQGVPQMPPMPQQPFTIPAGAQMMPVAGMPGMMAVQMPAGTSMVPAGTPQQSGLLEDVIYNEPFPEASAEEATEDTEDQQVTEEPEAPVVEPEKMTIQSATEAGLTMATQKRARKAVRTLVRKLTGTKETEWQGLIATAISNEIGIYHYVKAVTIRAALLEGGADEELAQRVMAAMRESGMIPSDVEYE